MRLRWVATLIRIRSWRLAAVCVAIALLALGTARVARAQVGKRNFIDALVTEDPNPDNELQPQPVWNKSRTENVYSFTLTAEKRLAENFSLEIADAINQVSPRQGADARGLSGLEFLSKWDFFTSVKHEARVAIGADAIVPVGDLDAGAPSHSRLGPFLMYEKGMGDLPDEGLAVYLRPFAVIGDFAYLPALGGPQNGQFLADVCLAYQLYYLSDSGIQLPYSSFLKKVSPFAEFNWQQIAVGKRFNTPPDFRITPALAYDTYYYQLTIGTQIALSHEASLNSQASVNFMLSIYLAKLWPGVFKWEPF
jgi:hypothetical protein